MNPSPPIDLARQIATSAHEGQVDKNGAAYIGHPARVAARVRGDDAAEIVAWLHDVVEDTTLTLEDLRAHFPESIVAAVDAMTRRSEEAPDAYYARVRADPIARAVKLADIADNTDPPRTTLPTDATPDRNHQQWLIGPSTNTTGLDRRADAAGRPTTPLSRAV
ncbi:MAG: HD domain-containing protein [Ornithinimicrobium sp.]